MNLDFISSGLLYKFISILSASYSKHSSDSPCLLHLYSNPHLSLHLCLFPRESLRTYISVCCCSAAQSCLTLYDPMDCSTPGFPVPHHLPELAQAHVHWVSDAIQPSHPLSSPSPPAFNLSQHESFPLSWLFASCSKSIGTSAPASVLPMNIQG